MKSLLVRIGGWWVGGGWWMGGGWVGDKTKIMESQLHNEVGVEVRAFVTTCPDGWVGRLRSLCVGWVVDKMKIMQSQLQTEV